MLTELAIKALQPRPVRYLISDGGGLNIEVLPSGSMSWVYRYTYKGRSEKMVIGRYPVMSLRVAREERNRRALIVAKGASPVEVRRQEREEIARQLTVREFGQVYLDEVVVDRWKDPAPVKVYLRNNVYPVIGAKAVSAVTALDVQSILFKKRASAKSAAGRLRVVLKGLFDYAIVKQLITVNPVNATPARFVHVDKARTRALSPDEITKFLTVLYASNILRQFKLALHLILLTLVRKNELLHARWMNVNLETREWLIPPDDSKNGLPHTVYLSTEAVAIFEELRWQSVGSDLVMPGSISLSKPVSESTLNAVTNRLDFGIEHFTLHDMRRTGSTLLHEQGWSSDVIEKSLNHAQTGVRGVYNRAAYAEQRREMLQHWGGYVAGLRVAEG